MADRKIPGSPLRKAAQIALLYALLAGAWISFSDVLVDRWLRDPAAVTHYQTLKGWGFVVVTALALLLLILHHLRAYERQLRRDAAQRAELRQLNQFHESIIDNASIWINVLDTSARVRVWNKAAEQVSGYGRDEVLQNDRIWEWLYPDPHDRSAIAAEVVEILERGTEVEGFESEILTKQGIRKTIAWNSRRLRDEHGEVIGSIAIGRDITNRKHTEDVLRERERQLATLLSNLPGMAYRCLDDENWTMELVSQGCQPLTGYEPAALVGNRELSYASLIHEDDRARVESEVHAALAEQRRFAIEYRIRRKDGEVIWVWEQGQTLTLDGWTGLEGIIIDINARKAVEQELERRAAHDPLTGLYNRRELEQQFRDELARAQRYGHPLGLLWLDVDRFKSVNDRFGHQTGDEVLRQLGHLLQSNIRTVDYVARYGGEELAIVLPEADELKAFEMAERLRRTVETTPMVGLDQQSVRVTISIGVAAFPAHGATIEHLIRVADRAMYRAKQEGRNRVCLAAAEIGPESASAPSGALEAIDEEL